MQWNLDLTKCQGTGKLVRSIKGSLNRKARYNEFAEKQPKCSLYRGIVNKYGLLTKWEVKMAPRVANHSAGFESSFPLTELQAI